MGDMSDLIDWGWNREEDIEIDYAPGIWTTNNGDSFKIEDMQTQHIINTLRYLALHENMLNFESDFCESLRDFKIAELKEELKNRGINYGN